MAAIKNFNSIYEIFKPGILEFFSPDNIKIVQNKVSGANIINIICENNSIRLGVQSLKALSGRITILIGEQIASFVELSVKRGHVDEDSAQEIRNSYKHIITVLRTRECPLFGNLREQYNALYSQLEKHILKSNENGKKVLILVGEEHSDRRSLLLDLIILDIASRLGVKSLLAEIDDNSLGAFLKIRKHMYIDELTSDNINFFLGFAENLGFEITACDPKPSQPGCVVMNQPRCEAINQSIVKSNTNSVCIGGLSHLMHISTDKAINDLFEILSINASHIGEEKKSHYFKCFLYIEQIMLSFGLNPDNAMQLNIIGNPYSLEFEQMEKLVKQLSVNTEVMQMQTLDLDGLDQLASLGLANCRQLTGLSSLDGLDQLQTLNLSNSNQLATLPELNQLQPLDLGGLDQLQTLNLSNPHQLATFPLSGEKGT